MKRTRFFAVLLTACLLMSLGTAGSSVLLQALSNNSAAQEVDNDIAGLMEGLDMNPGDLGGAMENIENFDPDQIPDIILGNLFGSIATTSPVGDDQLGTVTTIIQALMGGTQEGESTLDAIKEKLGDLGGTVTENELIQAIAATLLGFDFSNFDMSMLTSNEFISALMGNLGGINMGGATPMPTTQPSTVPTYTGAPLTTVPTQAPTVSSSINAQTPGVTTPVASTMPTTPVAPTNPAVPNVSAYPDSTTQNINGVGVIVDNTLNIQAYPSTDVNNVIPSVPEINSDMTAQPEKKVSGKMIVGIIVLLLSGISVVAVALVLKKNKD